MRLAANALSTAVPAHAEPAFPSPATLLHTLHIYGAAAITAFGWAVCALLDWDATPWLPLWFCGALLVYNLDRLRRDPADALNVPQRVAAMQRLHGSSALAAVLSAGVLVGVPILRRDWITLALVIGGALVCVSYSIPVIGFRLKDVPVLKTFIAPTIVTAAILGLPGLHEGLPARRALLVVVALRAWGFLLFNMILCDLRDVEGDRRVGTLSLPAWLGRRRTRGLLVVLILVIEGLTLAALASAPGEDRARWGWMAVAAPVYLSALFIAVRVPRSERFYEWFVEGMLFMPALVVALA